MSNSVNAGNFGLSLLNSYTFIDQESESWMEQNDIVILNVHTVKYIEVVTYMFQDVADKISIHTSPDLT